MDVDDWYGPDYVPWAVAALAGAARAARNATVLSLVHHAHALLNPDGSARLSHVRWYEGAHALSGYRAALLEMCRHCSIPRSSRQHRV